MLKGFIFSTYTQCDWLFSKFLVCISHFSKVSYQCKHQMLYHLEIPPTSRARSFLFKVDENRWSMHQTSQRIVLIWNATRKLLSLTRTHRHTHVHSLNIYLCYVWMSIQVLNKYKHTCIEHCNQVITRWHGKCDQLFLLCVTN